ncbi:MAG: hypothetical protein ACXWW2_10045 [Candidatus Deferrimicrobiaceae bacterium]
MRCLRAPAAKRLSSAFLLFLMVGLPLVSGCLFGEKRRTLPPQEAELFRAKADERLRKEAETGGAEPFAAIAVFRNDVFLEQSESLQRSSLTVLNEMGNVVILQLRPGEILPLLKDPSLRKLAWFGPQGLLARLEPSLELDMMARYGAGTEDRDVDLLLRLVDVGGANEERHVTAAGYRIVTKAGPTWVVTGPTARIPKLLESDQIAYIEGASKGRIMQP